MEKNLGDLICEKCNGRGMISAKDRIDKGSIDAVCPDCDGDGKFDWVEQVTGKKKSFKLKRTIVALPKSPSNPNEEDYYFDTVLKVPRIYRNNKWKTFDYFGGRFGSETG